LVGNCIGEEYRELMEAALGALEWQWRAPAEQGARGRLPPRGAPRGESHHPSHPNVVAAPALSPLLIARTPVGAGYPGTDVVVRVWVWVGVGVGEEMERAARHKMERSAGIGSRTSPTSAQIMGRSEPWGKTTVRRVCGCTE
jgi:hypothetical protein